MTMQLNY